MEELKFAFKQTLPILFSYVFMGIAFGIMLVQLGYHAIWAIAFAVFVYAGSLQFALIGLIQAQGSIWQAALMALFINARHIFYGLSFIERFRKIDWRRFYLIFSLTDETYSVLCNLLCPKELDEDKVIFLISLLDHLYWIVGCTLGAIIKEALPFGLEGIEFSATAFFLVVVIKQWQENQDHFPAIIGLISGLSCLCLFKADNFLIFALISCAAFLLLYEAFNKRRKE